MSDANPETPAPAQQTAATPPSAATVTSAPAAAAVPSVGPPTAAASASAAVVAEAEAPAAPKIKPKKPTQRACDEKDAKNKLCCGHLKRWYEYPKEIEALIGKKAEIYRCEFCGTLYKPSFSQAPHSYTIRY
jgi:hypothetical protein